MRLIRKLGLSAVLFLVGVVAFYIADLMLLRYANQNTIASWAILRSFTLLGGVVALFGFQALIVREPTAVKKVAKVAIPYLLIAALLISLLAVKMGWVENFSIGVGLILGYAVANYGFQWLRSTGRLSAAYTVNSTWRLIFLVGVFVGVMQGNYHLSLYLLVGFLISILIGLALIFNVPSKASITSANFEIKKYTDVVKLGGTLFLGGASLAISAHGESLIVKTIGTLEDVSMYYQALVLFLFPGIVLSQYLVAILEPLIRDNQIAVNAYISKYGAVGFIIMSCVLVPVIWTGGWFLQKIVSADLRLPLELTVLLAMTSALRIIYAFPSAYVGMIVNRSDLLRTMVGYLFSALCILPIAYILNMWLGSVVVSVALASLINWTTRLLLANHAIRKNLTYAKI